MLIIFGVLTNPTQILFVSRKWSILCFFSSSLNLLSVKGLLIHRYWAQRLLTENSVKCRLTRTIQYFHLWQNQHLSPLFPNQSILACCTHIWKNMTDWRDTEGTSDKHPPVAVTAKRWTMACYPNNWCKLYGTWLYNRLGGIAGIIALKSGIGTSIREVTIWNFIVEFHRGEASGKGEKLIYIIACIRKIES